MHIAAHLSGGRAIERVVQKCTRRHLEEISSSRAPAAGQMGHNGCQHKQNTPGTTRRTRAQEKPYGSHRLATRIQRTQRLSCAQLMRG